MRRPSLKLVTPPPQSLVEKSTLLKNEGLTFALKLSVLFLIIKFPMCWVTNHPEELRDFQSYVFASQGQIAYRDFIYIYGPLPPLLFGFLLKFVPHTLFSLRVISQLLWTVGAVFIGLILCRYFSKRVSAFGFFIVTSILGYPTYTHNHVVAAVAALGCAYFLIRYIEEQANKDLLFSFVMALVCFLSRPVLMGFGLILGWGIVILRIERARSLRIAALCAGITATTLLSLLAWYGPTLSLGFLPRPWLEMKSYGYPNLHFIFPGLNPFANGWVSGLQRLRVSFDVIMFYWNYFIWPVGLFVLTHQVKSHARLRAALILTLLSLVISFDVLHYGFPAPLTDLNIHTRKQFFLALSATAFFLVLWPENSKSGLLAKAKLLFLGIFLIWGHHTYASGIINFFRFKINEGGHRVMAGLSTHSDRMGLYLATRFINDHCQSGDRAVVLSYVPSASPLLKCEDPFSRDPFAFVRNGNYVFERGENPYDKTPGLTSFTFLKKRLVSQSPRFALLIETDDDRGFCAKPEWSSVKFGSGPDTYIVCFTGGFVRSPDSPLSQPTTAKKN